MRSAVLLAVLLTAVPAAAGSAIDDRSVQFLADVTEPVRNQIRAAIRRANGRLGKLYRQSAKLTQERRKKPRDQKLAKAQRELAAKIEQERKRAIAEMRKAGMTDELFEQLRSMPHGHAREQRVNHARILEAPDLTSRQRAVLEPLVYAVNGSLVALERSQSRVMQSFKKEDRKLGQQATARIREQFRQTERRFWNVIYYVLTPDQMRAVRPRLTRRYRNISQPRESMIALPGMTPSQGLRVTARFTEHQSEITADQAAVRRLGIELRRKDLTREQRQKINAERGACYRRMGACNQRLREDLSAILNEEQRRAYASLPPMLNLAERGRPPWSYTAKMALDSEARKDIQTLQRAVGSQLRDAQREARRAMQGMGGDMSELGPESPQAMGMQMMRQNQRGRRDEIMREAGADLMIEILAPHQIIRWVVGDA